jgi:hypothetical protein
MHSESFFSVTHLLFHKSFVLFSSKSTLKNHIININIWIYGSKLLGHQRYFTRCQCSTLKRTMTHPKTVHGTLGLAAGLETTVPFSSKSTQSLWKENYLK